MITAPRHLPLCAAVAAILPAEGDALLLEGQRAMIGNGHTVGVAAHIAFLVESQCCWVEMNFAGLQKGNNNAYCQDSSVSWMEWDLHPSVDQWIASLPARERRKRGRHARENKDEAHGKER